MLDMNNEVYVKFKLNYFSIKLCDHMSHLCFEAVESDHSNECHLVSAENYHFLNLEFPAKEEIFEKLRVMAQKWIGDVVEV